MPSASTSVTFRLLLFHPVQTVPTFFLSTSSCPFLSIQIQSSYLGPINTQQNAAADFPQRRHCAEPLPRAHSPLWYGAAGRGEREDRTITQKAVAPVGPPSGFPLGLLQPHCSSEVGVRKEAANIPLVPSFEPRRPTCGRAFLERGTEMSN